MSELTFSAQAAPLTGSPRAETGVVYNITDLFFSTYSVNWFLWSIINNKPMFLNTSSIKISSLKVQTQETAKIKMGFHRYTNYYIDYRSLQYIQRSR